MNLQLPSHAQAHVNHGRVIATCPFYPHCKNAMMLERGQKLYHCGGQGGCGAVAPLDWPKDLDGILEALSERRFKQYMNWYPKDHPIALASNCPMDQSVDDLRKETIAGFRREGISQED